MMKGDSAVINAMEKLTSYGPNVTMEVMYRMLQIDNVMVSYISKTRTLIGVTESGIMGITDKE